MAGAPRGARCGAVDIIAESECGKSRVFLERGCEGGGPLAATVIGELPRGIGERAARSALEDRIAADAKDHEILVTVIVDIDRIGAGDIGHHRVVEPGLGLLEFEFAACR